MSIKLDELRKRLLQQQDGAPGSAGAGATASAAPTSESEPASEAKTAAAVKPELKPIEPPKAPEPAVVKTIEVGQTKPAPKREEPAVTAAAPRPPVSPGLPKLDGALQTELSDSISKLFEQTKTFQVRFDELAQAIDLIERMTDSAARLFGPLRQFHGQLSQLAVSFESMRAFQGQLAQLGKTFEPMRLLHDQLAQLSDGIQTHVAQLVKSLDPAKDFRDRISALARAMDQASELQADFGELYSTFRASSNSLSREDDGAGEISRQRALG